MKHVSQLQKLKQNSIVLKNKSIKSLKSNNSNLTTLWKDFYVDFSKNIIDFETFSILCESLKTKKYNQFLSDFKEGKEINNTERRAVLHTTLRDVFEPYNENLHLDKRNETLKILSKIESFTQTFKTGNIKGFSGKSLKNIVHIGIGGSSLGIEMLYDVFQNQYPNTNPIYFLGNVDPVPVETLTKKIDLSETLIVVVSKTFTTQETLANCSVLKNWYLKNGCAESDLKKHFVAVTANPQKPSKDFGKVFDFSEWVGGRFSLWSAVGLSLSLSFGFDFFKDILKGANEMDRHFFETPIEQNIPAMYALITFWNISFMDANHNLVIPYSQRLDKLCSYLQQLETESNGKSVNRDGEFIDYKTMASLWGQPGSNAQHSIFQWLHQGTEKAQTDFIGIAQQEGDTELQQMLLSNLFAQIDTLAHGKSFEDALSEISDSELSESAKIKLARQKTFPGNKPNNLILIKELNPRNIGSLLAMFEHKVFVLGFLWNINSFDQFGVELGKTIAKEKLETIKKIPTLDFETIVQNLKQGTL